MPVLTVFTSTMTTIPQPVQIRLVDDILLQVFIPLAEKTRQAFHNVLSISHVCAHWRALALSCPELWRRYPFLTCNRNKRAHPELAKELLRRCGTLSIDVGWQTPLFRDETTLVAEMEQIHLCRSYEVTCSSAPNSVGAVLREMSRRRVPVMERLLVQMIPDLHLLDLAFPLHHFFDNDFPVLKSLETTNFFIPIANLHAPKLEDLTFVIRPKAWYPHSELKLHLTSMLQVVTSFPNLTRLKLQMSNALTSLPPDEPISMPRLIDLDLSVDAHATQAFFEHVRLPLCRRLKVDVWTLSIDDGAVAGLVSSTTGYIVQQLVVPLADVGTAISFVRCEDAIVETVLSTTTVVQRAVGGQPYDLSSDDFYLTVTAVEFKFDPVPILGGVAKGLLPLLGRVKVLKLPRNPSESESYSAAFNEFLQDSSISFVYP
jgi:hypothetical protein